MFSLAPPHPPHPLSASPWLPGGHLHQASCHLSSFGTETWQHLSFSGMTQRMMRLRKIFSGDPDYVDDVPCQCTLLASCHRRILTQR